MMSQLQDSFKVDPFQRLVYELSKLPGIGEKTATRLAYHILKQDRREVEALSTALVEAKVAITQCSTCCHMSDVNPCRYCAHPARDHGLVCVVERPADLTAIERSSSYRGVYHVLHGALSPLDGVGPDQLKIRELLMRLGDSTQAPVREIILATNPSVEGEATSLYLSKLLKPFHIKVTRIARGIPVGGQLEYTDRETLSRALENRMELS